MSRVTPWGWILLGPHRPCPTMVHLSVHPNLSDLPSMPPEPALYGDIWGRCIPLRRKPTSTVCPGCGDPCVLSAWCGPSRGPPTCTTGVSESVIPWQANLSCPLRMPPAPPEPCPVLAGCCLDPSLPGPALPPCSAWTLLCPTSATFPGSGFLTGSDSSWLHR